MIGRRHWACLEWPLCFIILTLCPTSPQESLILFFHEVSFPCQDLALKWGDLKFGISGVNSEKKLSGNQNLGSSYSSFSKVAFWAITLFCSSAVCFLYPLLKSECWQQIITSSIETKNPQILVTKRTKVYCYMFTRFPVICFDSYSNAWNLRAQSSFKYLNTWHTVTVWGF